MLASIQFYDVCENPTQVVFLKCFRNSLYMGIKFQHDYSTFILSSITVVIIMGFLFEFKMLCTIPSGQSDSVHPEHPLGHDLRPPQRLGLAGQQRPQQFREIRVAGRELRLEKWKFWLAKRKFRVEKWKFRMG